MSFVRVPGRAWIILLGVVALALPAAPAWAHRDGCHRWHSCPSDTGSYICGDLGHDSECPGGGADYSAPDFTAPSLVFSSQPAAVRGRVVLQVKAERRSRIRVLESGRLVASARATGDVQRVSFDALDGSHTYDVQAVDAADNTTRLDAVTVTVDGTAPRRPTLKLTPPTGLLAHTSAALTGEAAAKYTLTFTGAGKRITTRGVLDGSGQALARALVPNGSFAAAVTLSDAGQNTSPAATGPVTVRLPAPTLTLERSSAANSSATVIDITGPATGAGTLTLQADGPAPVTLPFRLDETGHGTASTTLADGLWSASALVTDFQKRPARGSLTGLTVDTVAPVLDVTIDSQAAENRHATATFDVEDGATVTVTGLPDGEKSFTTAGPARLDEQVDDGAYNLTFTAADLAGNETIVQRRVKVSHPLTLGEALTALAVLALLGAGVFFLTRLLWRRRFDLQARRIAGRLTREHARALAAHQAAVQAHASAIQAHRSAHVSWTAEGERLRHAAQEARTFHGVGHARPVPDRDRPGEIVYSHLGRAGLVEMRRPHGVDTPTVVESGEMWVTNCRVLYVGSKKREWSFDKLISSTDVGSDVTMMLVSNRKTASGIFYAGPQRDEIRRRLHLAIASSHGARDRVIAEADRQVTAHAGAEPRPPVPPPPAPPAPVLPTAAQLREAQTARKAAAQPAV